MFKKTYIQDIAIKLFGSSAREFLLVGGSRSGKSFIIIFVVVYSALKYAGSRHLIARYRFNAVKNAIWLDTLKKVLNVCFPGVNYKSNETDHYVRFPNGSEIWIAGLDDKERLEKILGMEFLNIFLNEASQISYEAYNMVKTRLAQKILYKKGEDYLEARRRLFIDENPPSKKHWTYRVFIENIEPLQKTRLNPDNYAHLTMNPDQNLENIGSDYMDILDGMSEAHKKRFKRGEFSDDSLEALWTSDLIGSLRVQSAPPLKRVVVSIDPAITSDPTDSDETGIIVEGIGFDDELYVLEDASGIYTPTEWAEIAVKLFDKHEADLIVAEVNQGGDMVETIIRTIRKKIPYKAVHATRDKRTRAEPIAAVYVQKKAHHVGESLDELELEMTTCALKKGAKSPNRIDALVWGAVELLPIMGVTKKKAPRLSQ